MTFADTAREPLPDGPARARTRRTSASSSSSSRRSCSRRACSSSRRSTSRRCGRRGSRPSSRSRCSRIRCTSSSTTTRSSKSCARPAKDFPESVPLLGTPRPPPGDARDATRTRARRSPRCSRRTRATRSRTPGMATLLMRTGGDAAAGHQAPQGGAQHGARERPGQGRHDPPVHRRGLPRASATSGTRHETVDLVLQRIERDGARAPAAVRAGVRRSPPSPLSGRASSPRRAPGPRKARSGIRSRVSSRSCSAS